MDRSATKVMREGRTISKKKALIPARNKHQSNHVWREKSTRTVQYEMACDEPLSLDCETLHCLIQKIITDLFAFFPYALFLSRVSGYWWSVLGKVREGRRNMECGRRRKRGRNGVRSIAKTERKGGRERCIAKNSTAQNSFLLLHLRFLWSWPYHLKSEWIQGLLSQEWKSDWNRDNSTRGRRNRALTSSVLILCQTVTAILIEFILDLVR